MHSSKSAFLILVAMALVTIIAAPSLSAPTDQQYREEFTALAGRLADHQRLAPAEKARYEELRKLLLPTGRSEVNPLDNQGGPDQFGYFFVDNVAPDTATFSWIELCGDPDATDGPGDTEDGCGTASIGFDFPFYGSTYSTCYPSTNGLIGFIACDWEWCATDPETSEPVNPFIAPYWRDQSPFTGTAGSGCNGDGNAPWIRWKMFGTSPDRYFVVEWRRNPQYLYDTAVFSYEAILYENGRIKIQFNTDNMEPAGWTCYVGIGVDAPGGNGLRYFYDDGQNPLGYAPQPERAIWIFQADGIPNTVTDLQGVVNGADVTLSWIDPTTDTNGNPITLENVQVWLGPVGSGELLATVAPGLQTFTHVGAGDGFHTYNVRPFNDPYYGSSRSVTVLVGDFPWHPTDYEWVDIESVGTLLPLSLDDYSDVIDLGFEFTFFDQTFTQLWVASHGFVTLDDPTFNSPPFVNQPIPDPMIPNNALYCFWDDNSSQTTGGIYYYQDTAEGRFIVSWNGVGHFISGEQYWFQLILNDDGSIVMNYQTIPINNSCTIGVEDGTGSNALQACYDGTGDFLPTSNSAIIFYEQSGVTAPVSGHVTLDGGIGGITQVLVQASGPGHPTTNPDASGNYALDSVSTGNRRIMASRAGYVTDTLQITLDSTGLTGADLTLRRIDPPAPTGFQVVSVNNNTGLVVLDWANSVDPLVDYYNVYRKLSSDPGWTFDERKYASADTDTLVTDGIYFYCVTALDSGVTPPAVESAYSTPDTALFGELAPHGLQTIGTYDEHIHLTWLAPGQEPGLQLSCDDNTAETWTTVQSPSGERDYMGVRFTPPAHSEMDYPLLVQACNLYLNGSIPLPNLWLCPDNGAGAPDLNHAYGNWQGVSADEVPGWLTVSVNGGIALPSDMDFWVVWQMPRGLNGPGVGTSTNAPPPSQRSYWSSSESGSTWAPATGREWLCRVWVGGEAGRGSSVVAVGKPVGASAQRLHFEQITLSPEMAGRLGMVDRPAASKSAGPVRTGVLNPVKTPVFPVTMTRGFDPVHSQAPALEYQRSGPGNPLDDIEYYKIYRNGAFLVQDPAPPYDDVVGSANEGVTYSYYVTAHYDNNEDSPPSNTVTGIANMAPGAPTSLTGEPLGASQMRLMWQDPTVNADGTPCTDLANVRIFRDGQEVGLVNAGVQEFSDTPPQPDMFYMWTVAADDEVPNEGPVSAGFTGAVISPWQQEDYEWVDITSVGTLIPLSLDEYSDAIDLGFTFTFFGQDFTQLWVASHGFVTLNDPSFNSPPFTETQIPNPQEPNNAIYCFWDDNSSVTTGGIYYYRDTANARFIVAWVGVGHFGTGETYTFETILGDDGSITNEYSVIPFNTSCAIGAEDGAGSNGVQVCYDGTGWLPTEQSAVSIWGGPSGRIEGVVREFGTNQPIEGIRVEIAEGPEFSFTDNTGFYSLRLEPGLYTVTFGGQGYCDTTYADLLVEDHSTTVRNAILRSPNADFSVTSISMATWPGHDVSYSFEISNPGGMCPLDFSIADTSVWLSADPESGTIPIDGSMTVNAVATVQGLNPGGEYQSALIVTHDASVTPTVVPVLLLISLSGDPDPATLPTEYALRPNYPNPFNATTMLRFDLPQETRVKLQVFNIMGQSVATVADGMYPAGRYQFGFDATNLPSGMYLVKLRAGNYDGMQKMLLLK